jgi:hypothetical protein
LAGVSNLGNFILFADDLNLFFQNKDRNLLYTNANKALAEIYDYWLSNRLVIDFDKCCFIEFGS